MASFLSTLSLRRATHIGQHIGCTVDISIHALLAESDPPVLATSPAPSKFLSTLSLRRATIPFITSMASVLFLSTLSLRRATTRSTKGVRRCRPAISIHALLAESDFSDYRCCLRVTDISIHALLAESDLIVLQVLRSPKRFLSTLSLRRATILFNGRVCVAFRFLSTLSLRRATRSRPWGPGLPGISIHALLAESDVNEDRYGQQYWRFLSTLSLRRATRL